MDLMMTQEKLELAYERASVANCREQKITSDMHRISLLMSEINQKESDVLFIKTEIDEIIENWVGP